MTASGGGPTRKRRRLLGVGLVALAASGVLAAGLLEVTSVSPPEVDPVKDKAGLAVVRQRLSAALGDVNDVTGPANARPTGTAYVTTCAVDSGEVFEPALYREWRLLGTARSATYDRVTDAGRRVGTSIAAELIEHGWSDPTELSDQDFPAIGLTKRYDGYTVAVTIQVFAEVVLVSGGTRHPRVCRHQA